MDDFGTVILLGILNIGLNTCERLPEPLYRRGNMEFQERDT
jgi:hypothetical protein